MKLTYKNETGMKFSAEKPDEALSKYFQDKIAEAVQSEISAFVQEASVAMRKLRLGKKLTLRSRPIIIEMERPIDEEDLETCPGHPVDE